MEDEKLGTRADVPREDLRKFGYREVIPKGKLQALSAWLGCDKKGNPELRISNTKSTGAVGHHAVVIPLRCSWDEAQYVLSDFMEVIREGKISPRMFEPKKPSLLDRLRWLLR